MKLYFTRHGKTEWNQQKRFQGMTGDSPLLPTSYDEIKQLGQYLQDIPFEKIYSSPLLRAKNTARGIQQELNHPVEIVYTDTLKELGLGRLEGQCMIQQFLMVNQSSKRFNGFQKQLLKRRNSTKVQFYLSDTEQR